MSNAIRLEATLRPKNCFDQAWFQLCRLSLQLVTEFLQNEEQKRIDAEKQQYLDLIAEDLQKLKVEFANGCASFLRYLNENYVPQDKKLNLTDDLLTENKLKHTMVTKFSRIFHPDRQVNEEKKKQVLCEEIMKLINNFIDQFKGN